MSLYQYKYYEEIVPYAKDLASILNKYGSAGFRVVQVEEFEELKQGYYRIILERYEDLS